MQVGHLKHKPWLRYSLAIFFVIAGINHFLNPAIYIPLIPDYFPMKYMVNFGSGFLEVLFGGLLFMAETKKMAAFGIIGLLVAFIPSHIYFIQIGGCIKNGLCVPLWVGWVRLIIVHPLLILWAYFASKR